MVKPNEGRDWTPIPDPTVLTTELLQRESSALRELLETHIKALKELLDIKINAVDETCRQRHDSLAERLILIRDNEVRRIDELFTEKFIGVAERFAELDKRHDQNLDYSKTALAAALASQKESVGKTELSFSKQIDQMQVLVNTIAKTTDEKIDDLRERFTLTEGKTAGHGESWAFAIAAGGIVLGAIGAFSVFFR